MPTLFHRYNELLKRHPFTVNGICTGSFFFLGDVLAQKLFPHVSAETITDHNGESIVVEHIADYSLARSARAATYGVFIFSPISVLWHNKTLPYIKNPFIDFFKRKKMEKVPALRKRLHFYDSVFRLSIDQLIFPGFVWIPLYNTTMVLLAQREDPFNVIKDKLENNWWRVLKSSWTVWPPFQLFNLYFIPVHLRIVASNIWATGWNTFLSFVHNTKGHGHGSGRRFEELVDIDDDDQEFVMFYD
ncbi:Ethanol metabolism and heat shock tolerance protein, putative [Candida maltosa Xu316]|uniref:Protein SYM1 n=1 Tax=Candida maltosa (strain Xu316) TaxID=1245528 RepID=M3K7A7_CANMX|nr:Ethanol metabolism and heat shock tolerance protein, putative [Candida maltosa Xu316]